jgi:8-oxo-dGTP pyrophosphatase MutT (NUDIX family)
MPTIRISPRAIIRRGQLFLVVHYFDRTGDWYIFPGGGQQHGEDLHQTLRREVEEEIGVSPSIGQLRFVRECIASRLPASALAPDFHQLEIFFDCTIDQDPLPAGQTPDPHQVGIEWRAVPDLRNCRFFPQAILDLLDEPQSRYLGAC